MNTNMVAYNMIKFNNDKVPAEEKKRFRLSKARQEVLLLNVNFVLKLPTKSHASAKKGPG